MKVRRNFVWAPWLIWAIAITVVGGGVAGYLYYDARKKAQEAAEERAALIKKVTDAASYIGLAGLGLGIGALAIKGGMAPPRMKGM